MLDGELPWRLPATIAASLVFLKSTYDISCLSSVPELHAAVNASPFQVACCCPSNTIGSVAFPAAVNSLQVPSNDNPLPGATWITVPGSIVKSEPMDRYPLAELGLTLIGESILDHVVGWVISALTSVPFPSNGITLVLTEQSSAVVS